MADDEQFSLCWNNFNTNLSAGFHESLCRGDLVDVTLAAEGQFVKAHRLVLSVCSPYFRKMFTQMPANQHAFVFLKDVSHTALKDLIQFMYCGEVNVKQEALPAFISTAEALQIKGLTDSDPPPSQSPAEPSTPTPQIQQLPSPRIRSQQRTSTTRSYKIETVEDPVQESKQSTQIVIQTTAAPPQTTIAPQTQHVQQSQQQHHTTQITNPASTTTVVTQKRPAPRSIGSAPHIKRTKSTTIDPLEVAEPSTQQITVQTAVVTSETKVQPQSEPEYIDLPIELPTKSEPDYADDTGDVEAGDHDAAYVEDDSYGEMRYDESYFTENEETPNTTVAVTSSGPTATTSKAIVKQQTSFSDSSYVDATEQTSNSEAQEIWSLLEAIPGRKRGRPKLRDDGPPQEKLLDKISSIIRNNKGLPAVYASTTKGGMKLIYDGHHFRYSFRKGQYSIFQCCYKENKEDCKVRIVSDQKRVYPLDGEHVHYVQATDKSVTAVRFKPSDPNEEYEQGIEDMTSKSEIFTTEALIVPKIEAEEIEQPENDNILETSSVEAIDFREKIKKRLQKALLGKKKS